jgi:hypothetical protein
MVLSPFSVKIESLGKSQLARDVEEAGCVAMGYFI